MKMHTWYSCVMHILCWLWKMCCYSVENWQSGEALHSTAIIMINSLWEISLLGDKIFQFKYYMKLFAPRFCIIIVARDALNFMHSICTNIIILYSLIFFYKPKLLVYILQSKRSSSLIYTLSRKCFLALHVLEKAHNIGFHIHYL